jgi:stringent starvation protein B
MNFDRLLYHQFNALYGWMQEEGFIPEIIVDTRHPDIKLPEYLKAHQRCILNIDCTAVTLLNVTSDAATFNARFGGQPFACYIPMRAVEGFQSRSIKAQHGNISFGMPKYPASDTPTTPATTKPKLEVVPTTPTDSPDSTKVVSLMDRRKK